MQRLLKLPLSTKTVKWDHVEALVKIWEIFREIPSLIDGSFVGRFTRHSCNLNNDLNTYIGVMTNVEQLADKELGRKMAAMTQWRANKKNLPQPVCPETGKLLKKDLSSRVDQKAHQVPLLAVT